MKKEGIKYDYTFTLAENIGKKYGLTYEEIDGLLDTTRNYHSNLNEDRETGKVGFYDLPDDKKNAKAVQEFADKNRDKFDNFVVLGIGGSALGNIALQNSLNHLFYNYLPKKERKGPKIFVLDNVDPEYVSNFMDVISPGKTLFNVISKSGSTAETAAQFLIFVNLLRSKMDKKFNKNLVLTTDAENGDLRKIADDYKINSFVIPENVGGRFSVLTNVGLLTAAFAGLNIKALLKGAEDMRERCSTDNLYENPAYLNAAVHYLMDKKKRKNISVMMSYSNSLYYWADWYRQLWAESLGKNLTKQGKKTSTGQTPINALGATDQHSQVQLYTEGPNDKVFTFLTTEKYRADIKMNKFKKKYSSLEYLSGKKLSELFNAEMKATEYALTEAGRPSCKIIFPEINEYTIGQFIMMYEIQTAFAGELYNIDAFNQPGVEAGKKATYGLLGREGFEDEAVKILERDKNRQII